MATLAAGSPSAVGGKTPLERLKGSVPCGCERCKQLIAEKNAPISVFEACTDDRFSKFLRGCKGDVGKAAHVLTGSLVWRHEVKADDAANDSDQAAEREERIQAALPYVYTGYEDKRGHTVYIEMTGLCDVPRMLEIGAETFLANHVRVNEKCLNNKTGMRLAILDLTGLNSSMMGPSGFQLMKKMIDLDQRHYPESLYKFYIVNAPWLLSTAFEIVKPWLDPISLEKIEILGENFKDVLLQEIDAGQLPKHLGGTCQRPFGCVKVNPSLRRGEVALVDETMFKIDAGSSKGHSITIPQDVANITIVLRSANYDGIVLGISMSVKGLGTKHIVKPGKYNCKTKPIVGTFDVNKAFFEGEVEGNVGASEVGGERVLALNVNNAEAWMYSVTLFFEIRCAKTGTLLL